jgi:hypothetical protein
MFINIYNLTSVIILYQIQSVSFQKVLSFHVRNSKNIILVNNSPEISVDSFISPQVKIINNPGNVGLAVALNIGISEA